MENPPFWWYLAGTMGSSGTVNITSSCWFLEGSFARGVHGKPRRTRRVSWSRICQKTIWSFSIVNTSSCINMFFFDLYLYESWFSTMYRKIDSLNLSWTMKPQLMKSIFLQWNVRVLWLFVSVFWSRVYYNYSYTGCRYHGFSYPFWRVCLWNSTSIPKIRPYLNGTTISNPSSLIY